MCDATFTTKNGTITSPNYPSNYPSSQTCVWLVDLGPGYDVRVTFHKFWLEEHPDCSYDYVLIREGVGDSAPVKARLCSNIIPPALSTRGPMRIQFVADTDKEFQGFMATYIAYGELSVYNSDTIS